MPKGTSAVNAKWCITCLDMMQRAHDKMLVFDELDGFTLQLLMECDKMAVIDVLGMRLGLPDLFSGPHRK